MAPVDKPAPLVIPQGEKRPVQKLSPEERVKKREQEDQWRRNFWDEHLGHAGSGWTEKLREVERMAVESMVEVGNLRIRYDKMNADQLRRIPRRQLDNLNKQVISLCSEVTETHEAIRNLKNVCGEIVFPKERPMRIRKTGLKVDPVSEHGSGSDSESEEEQQQPVTKSQKKNKF